MDVCCVLPVRCGGSWIYNFRIFTGGDDGDFATSMLKMSASLFSADVCYSPS